MYVQDLVLVYIICAQVWGLVWTWIVGLILTLAPEPACSLGFFFTSYSELITSTVTLNYTFFIMFQVMFIELFCDWQVGFTDEGKLNGVKIFFYADCGASPNENSIASMYTWLDSGETSS